MFIRDILNVNHSTYFIGMEVKAHGLSSLALQMVLELSFLNNLHRKVLTLCWLLELLQSWKKFNLKFKKLTPMSKQKFLFVIFVKIQIWTSTRTSNKNYFNLISACLLSTLEFTDPEILPKLTLMFMKACSTQMYIMLQHLSKSFFLVWSEEAKSSVLLQFLVQLGTCLHHTILLMPLQRHSSINWLWEFRWNMAT